jgi:hypothetical protein
MNRRDFIVSAIGAAALAALPLPAEKYTYKTYKIGYTLTQEGQRVPMDPDIGLRMAKALARSMMQTKEQVAGRVFSG